MPLWKEPFGIYTRAGIKQHNHELSRKSSHTSDLTLPYPENSWNNPERRLQEVSGVPVFGSVVMAWTESQRAKRKKGLMAFLLSFASLLSAYAAIMAALMLSAARA